MTASDTAPPSVAALQPPDLQLRHRGAQLVGLFVPLQRLGAVLTDAVALLVGQGEVERRGMVALVGALAEPLDRLGRVPGDAEAVGVGVSECAHRLAAVALRRGAVPRDRLAVVLRDAEA